MIISQFAALLSPLMDTNYHSTYISVCLHNLFRWRMTTHYARTEINGSRSPRINRYNYRRSQMNYICGSHAVPRRKVCMPTELARFPTDLHRLSDKFCSSLFLLCLASSKNSSWFFFLPVIIVGLRSNCNPVETIEMYCIIFYYKWLILNITCITFSFCNLISKMSS